ncbi:MAG: hypothetical protein HRU34_06245 [Richelia sp.]|nr:hypothetical protein [Richelia sp.]
MFWSQPRELFEQIVRWLDSEDVLKVEVSYKSCKSPYHDTYHCNID